MEEPGRLQSMGSQRAGHDSVPKRSTAQPCDRRGFLGGSDDKESACNAGDLGSIPGLGRSPGAGHGNPLQYSCLENPRDKGAWWAAVYGVAESDMTEAT